MKKKYKFIFCHGWGYSVHFWQKLAKYFQKENCIYWDLGYFGKPSQPILQHDQLIGIGHSLGMLKLIQEKKLLFKAMIGLQGFINFLGFDSVMRRTRTVLLQTMQNNLIKYPKQTLQNFYTRCGIPDYAFSRFNIEQLYHDLSALYAVEQFIACPTLIIGSNNDSIIPIALLKDNININTTPIQLITYTYGKHGLGYIAPSDVYNNIYTFLKDHVQ